jgi:cytochrome c-type biogenesis protein CcmH
MPISDAPLLFWGIAAAMTALALAFVLPRLLARQALRDDVSRGETNVAVYRGQLADLEIERRLLDEAGIDDRAGATGPKMPRTALALSLALPLAAFALYAVFGNPALLRVEPSDAPVFDAGAVDPAAMGGALARHLERNPRDGRGWVLLGRQQMERDRFAEAAVAFANALAASPKVARDPSVWCDYADALGMAQGGSLEGKPREVIGRALALDPGFPRALEMAGSAAYERRDFTGAADHWRRLLPQLREGTRPHAELAAAIARADRLAAAAGVPSAARAADGAALFPPAPGGAR